MIIPKFTVEENSPLYQTYLAEREDRGENYSFEEFLEKLTGGKRIEDEPPEEIQTDEPPPENYFAQNLKYLRLRHGWTTSYLCHLLACPLVNLNRLESAEVSPTAETVIKVVEIFNVKATELCFEDLALKFARKTRGDKAIRQRIMNNILALKKRTEENAYVFSKQIGIDQHTVRKWGSQISFVKFSTLIKFAKYFNVSMDDLLFKDISNNEE